MADPTYTVRQALAKGEPQPPAKTPSYRRPRRKRGKTPSEEWINDRVEKAKSLHANRVEMIRDVMDKYKRVYENAYKDRADTKTTLIKTPRGEAIVDVMYSLLSIGADLECQVLPQKGGEKELALCTKLERGLAGIQDEIESRTGKVPFHGGTHWFLVKGMAAWKVSYRPHLEMPIVVDALDPQFVYPVEGDELLWVVEERDRYVGELKQHLYRQREGKDGRKLKWRMPKFEIKQRGVLRPLGDDEQVTVTEYQDLDWEACKVGDEFLYIRPNELGFFRYAFSKGRYTPDSDPAWQAQSILAPMLGLLELETELLTKFGISLDLFFFPYVLVQSPDGRAVIMHGAPGELENIPFEAKITVLRPESNVQEAMNLLGQAQSLMNIIGLPTVMFGEPPGQVQAGYPMALLLNAAKTRLRREAHQLEWGLAKTQEIILRMIDRFGGLNGGIEVYTQPEGSRRKSLLKLTDEDVAGHFRVAVSISPKLPQDWMQLSQIAQQFRQPGVDGKPLLDDGTIREDIMEMGAPEEIEEKLWDDRMNMHPVVMKYRERKWLEEFAKKEKVDLAELLGPPQEAMQRQPSQAPAGLVRPKGLGEMGVPPEVMPPAMSGVPPVRPAGIGERWR